VSTNGRTPTRRQFLRAVSWGAAGTVVAGALVGSEVGGTGFLGAQRAAGATPATLSLIATDGYITMPNRAAPVYIFGFVQVDPTKTISELSAAHKGHAQHTAPMLDFKQEEDIRITLTNLGLVQRPDLIDSHTIHWHGFDVPTPLNDGVPEVSVAVPIGKQFTYFYRPHRAGTYMYHCHFEDVEHVQMGMTGIVFVRPTQDGTAKTFGGKTLSTCRWG
jgi:FtsP/CotA-like multicopper oxidase with cupredoxin domain